MIMKYKSHGYPSRQMLDQAMIKLGEKASHSSNHVLHQVQTETVLDALQLDETVLVFPGLEHKKTLTHSEI